jgi:hypothetical protein
MLPKPHYLRQIYTHMLLPPPPPPLLLQQQSQP